MATFEVLNREAVEEFGVDVIFHPQVGPESTVRGIFHEPLIAEEHRPGIVELFSAPSANFTPAVVVRDEISYSDKTYIVASFSTDESQFLTLVLTERSTHA